LKVFWDIRMHLHNNHWKAAKPSSIDIDGYKATTSADVKK